jgi:hypothetical protein
MWNSPHDFTLCMMAVILIILIPLRSWTAPCCRHDDDQALTARGDIFFRKIKNTALPDISAAAGIHEAHNLNLALL